MQNGVQLGLFNKRMKVHRTVTERTSEDSGKKSFHQSLFSVVSFPTVTQQSKVGFHLINEKTKKMRVNQIFK